jgi:hypothetical protein
MSVEQGSPITETRLVEGSRLQPFVQRVLVAADVPEQDALIVAECLVTANLSRESTLRYIAIGDRPCEHW